MSVTLPESDIEPTYPNPPRFGWTKRILASSLIILCTLGAIIWWWHYEAHRRLVEEIQLYRSRFGIVADKPGTSSLPAEQNAALAFQQASASLSFVNMDRNVLMQFDPAGRLDQKGYANLQRIIAANTASFDMARRARFMRSAWVPASGLSFTSLYSLSSALKVNSFIESSDGNPAAAIETVLDMLRLATLPYEYPQISSLYLYHSRLLSPAAQAASAVSWQLDVLPHGVTTQPTGLASAEQVGNLISVLLDDSAQQRTAVAYIVNSRLQNAEYAMKGYSGRLTLSERIRSLVALPLLEMDSCREIRGLEKLTPALNTENYQVAEPATRRIWFQLTSLTAFTHPRRESSNMQRNFVISHFQAMTERRAAALQLAVRLYCLDHQGAFPPALTDLVPTYLPHVPNDPFAAGNQPFIYSQTPTPLIYSVGLNGRDDRGGSHLTLASRRWDDLDANFPLVTPVPSATRPNSGN